MSLFASSVVYEEVEDDGLRPAFSPIAIQRKFESSMAKEANELTSKVVEVVPKVTVGSTSRTETPRPRKRKNKDRYDEPLQEFLARRKKAKKEKKNERRGFQLMITDYFRQSKPLVKVEKKDQPSTSCASTSSRDILQSEQYTFDPTSVPQDDDIEIIDEIPARDTDARKSTPFVYVIPETQMDPIKEEEETKPECPDEDDAMDGIGDTSSVNKEDNKEAVKQDADAMEFVSDAISLESEVLDEPEKPTEKEMMLMLQVQELSKGLEEMKAMMNRKKRIETTAKVASKLKQKLMKQKRRKTAQPKPIFDKPMKQPVSSSETRPSEEDAKKSDEEDGFLQPQPEPMNEPQSPSPKKSADGSDSTPTKQDDVLQPQPEPIQPPQSPSPEKSSDGSETTPTKEDGFLQPQPEPMNEPQSPSPEKSADGSDSTPTKQDDVLQPQPEPIQPPQSPSPEKSSDGSETTPTKEDGVFQAQPEETSRNEGPSAGTDHDYTKPQAKQADVSQVESGDTPQRNEVNEAGIDAAQNSQSQFLFSASVHEGFTEDEISDSQLIESTKYMNIHDTVNCSSVVTKYMPEISFTAEVHVSADVSEGTQCTASEALAFLEKNTEELTQFEHSEEYEAYVANQPAEISSQYKEVEAERMTTRSENDLLGDESQMSDVDEETAA